MSSWLSKQWDEWKLATPPEYERGEVSQNPNRKPWVSALDACCVVCRGPIAGGLPCFGQCSLDRKAGKR